MIRRVCVVSSCAAVANSPPTMVGSGATLDREEDTYDLGATDFGRFLW